MKHFKISRETHEYSYAFPFRVKSEQATLAVEISVCLSNAHFGVGSVDFAKGFADFADGGVGADGLHDVWHGICRRNVSVGSCIRLLSCGFLQGLQGAADFVIRAASAQSLEFCRLLLGYALVDVESVGWFFVDDKLIYA